MTDRTSRRQARRLSLRSRIMLSFSVGSLLLSLLLSGGTYVVTRDNLVDSRQDAAIDQTMRNADFMRLSLGSARPKVQDLLSSVPKAFGARSIIRYRDQWYDQTSVEASNRDLPTDFRASVLLDGPSYIYYASSRGPRLAVGISMPSVDAMYFEVTPLDDLERTLANLALALAVATILVTALGALLGHWAAGRILEPLRELGGAASAIADDDLDVRLADQPDRDLQGVVVSFNNMARRLQERIERDARFASDVSHELRSPLTTMQASIEVLQNGREELPERSREALDLLTADLERFRQLVSDLLEISRFDAGAAHLQLEPLLVFEFLRQARSLIGADDIPIEAGPGTDELIAEIDKRRLVQMLANLVQNAEKYGGGATAITFDRVDDGIEIGVEDLGGGVPESERDRIFERFSRGVEAGKRGAGTGAGLGLALVAEHARLHEGRVWVADRPDGADGARFAIFLPAVESPHDDADEPESTASPTDGALVAADVP